MAVQCISKSYVSAVTVILTGAVADLIYQVALWNFGEKEYIHQAMVAMPYNYLLTLGGGFAAIAMGDCIGRTVRHRETAKKVSLAVGSLWGSYIVSRFVQSRLTQSVAYLVATYHMKRAFF